MTVKIKLKNKHTIHTCASQEKIKINIKINFKINSRTNQTKTQKQNQTYRSHLYSTEYEYEKLKSI